MSLRLRSIALVVLAASIGCQRTPVVTTPPPVPTKAKPAADELADTVREAVKKSSDIGACRRLVESLNAALARPDAPHRPEALSPARREFLSKEFALTPAELNEVGRVEFTPLDAYFLDECFLLRDAATSLDVKHLPKPEQARLALGWATRNLRTFTGAQVLPVQFLLLRGGGSPLEHCYAMLALTTQLGLDACLLADPDGKAPDFGIWGVGILDGGKVYAYDPRLGLPLGTLDDVRSGAALKPLAIDANLPYDVTAERAKATVALVTAPLGGQSPRMAFLESLLPPGGGRLTVDLPALSARFKAAGVEARTWNPPSAQSYARLLAAFLPTSEGGTDTAEPGKRRIDTYLIASVPWNLLPPFLGELGGEPGGKVRAAFAERTTMFNQPGQARDLILRGQFAEATEQLVAHRARMARRPHSEQEMKKIAEEWAANVTRDYANLLRAERAAKSDPAAAANVVAARERMDVWWRDARLTWQYMDILASGPLTAESTYLLALAKHEQAERLTHRPETANDADAWQSAIEWWRTYLGTYANSGAAASARRNMALALAASGRSAEAKAAFAQLQTSDLTSLEKLACKVRAAQIRQ